MFGVTGVPEFNYVTGNVLTTRPTANFGTAHTPGNNTYGTYTEILSDTNVTRDCYRVLINVNSVLANTLAKDALLTIGIDTSGGTAYADLINDLLVSCAPPYVTTATKCGVGHWYDFPLYIPAGSAIAAKGSVNNVTVGAMRIAIWLFGAPSDPASLKVGQGVETIGSTPASSTGTAVTSGAASEGTWTSLGTTAKNCFHWNMGMGINNAACSDFLYHADLSYGDGTNNRTIIQDNVYGTSTLEGLGSSRFSTNYCSVPAGSTIYGRLQCSGAGDSGLSLAAYGVY